MLKRVALILALSAVGCGEDPNQELPFHDFGSGEDGGGGTTDSDGAASAPLDLSPAPQDPGPTISILEPSGDTAHGAANIEVLVTDPQSTIATLQGSIRSAGDVIFTPTSGSSPLHATATIDFSKFSPALDGKQVLTVTATNQNGVQGTAFKQFTVDNAGPAIAITSPASGSFVGGVVEIRATITDDSEIDEGSVQAYWGNDPTDSTRVVQLKPVSSSSSGSNSQDYSGYFDVRLLGPSFVQPVLSVRAKDVWGSSGAASEVILVDNTPPRLALDPPKVRVAKKSTTGDIVCSALFDPLGDLTDGSNWNQEAVNEGQVVKQVFTIRARIEDDGNDAPGLLVVRKSGLDYASPTVYIIPTKNDQGQPNTLAVDTDHDGQCDEVNPAIVPIPGVTAPGKALALPLEEVPLGGMANYIPESGAPASELGCSQIGDTPPPMAPPDPLCPYAGTNLTFVLPTPEVGGARSQIFSIPKVDASSAFDCLGLQVDSLNKLPEGPACAIVRAVDNAGNQNVSPVLHFCIDRGGGKCTSYDPNEAGADCTGTYDKTSGVLDAATACDRRHFEFVPSSGLTFDTLFPAHEVIEESVE